MKHVDALVPYVFFFLSSKLKWNCAVKILLPYFFHEKGKIIYHRNILTKMQFTDFAVADQTAEYCKSFSFYIFKRIIITLRII